MDPDTEIEVATRKADDAGRDVTTTLAVLDKETDVAVETEALLPKGDTDADAEKERLCVLDKEADDDVYEDKEVLEKVYDDEAKIKSAYYPDCADLIKSV